MTRPIAPIAVLLLAFGLAACGRKPAATPPTPPPDPANPAPAKTDGGPAVLPPGWDASTPEHLRPGPQPVAPPSAASTGTTFGQGSEIKPVRAQLTSLSLALNRAAVQRQAEVNRQMADHMRAGEQISELQRKADAARDAGQDEEAERLRQQADALQAKQAAWSPPPPPPDTTKADLAFEQLLRRFREEVKRNQASGGIL